MWLVLTYLEVSWTHFVKIQTVSACQLFFFTLKLLFLTVCSQLCSVFALKKTLFLSTDPFQLTSLSDLSVEDERQSWQRDAERRDDRSPLPVPSSLSDLLTIYRTTGDRQQSPPRVSDTPDGSVVLGEQEDVANWFTSSRKKRNFSLGVAGMCCSQGCTKNDIGRLCWGRREGRGGGSMMPAVDLGSIQCWR